MRVICVDATHLTRPVLTEGETYTVYEENNWFFTTPVYFLEEVDNGGRKHPFCKSRFIPLDGPDETSLVSEEFEEKYCETVK